VGVPVLLPVRLGRMRLPVVGPATLWRRSGRTLGALLLFALSSLASGAVTVLEVACVGWGGLARGPWPRILGVTQALSAPPRNTFFSVCSFRFNANDCHALSPLSAHLIWLPWMLLLLLPEGVDAGRFTRWDWTEEGAATCIFHGLATCAPLEKCAIGDCIVVQREDGPSVRPKQAVIDALIRMGHSLERAVEAVAFWGLGGVLADEALCARWLALRPPGRCVAG
jgi:hypothetical protein